MALFEKAALSHPLSRGYVNIQSANIGDPPIINLKYFSHPADLEIMAEYILQLHKLVALPPLTDLLKQPVTLSQFLSNFANLDSAKNYIRLRATTIWHPAGTYAMLTRDKVYGMKKLRVFNASVAPLLPPANLQSTIYALAEKAANLIKEEYGLK
ncbi:hypothetical protein Hte_008484 [Hypoxylon texense]